jgi:hypothetical protein
MSVLSYTSDGTQLLGKISYDFSSHSIGGGDFKFPVLIDVFGDVSGIPVEAGFTLYLQYMLVRCTLACTATITNISAGKSALSPLTLGSFVFESFGFKKSPGFWNYLNQETQPMLSFSERDTIGDYPGNAAYPYGMYDYPINAVNADTIYVRCDGALPESCTLGLEYLVERRAFSVPPSNKVSFSYFGT